MLTNQDQWNTVEDILEQIARETQQELKRKKPRQQHNKPSQNKCKNCRFKKPNIPITNLSNHQLSRDEISLLSKGLNFIPTPRRDQPAKMLHDILLFDRKIRLKYYFYNDSDETTKAIQHNTQTVHSDNKLLHPSSGWTFPSGQDPFLDTYRNSIINEFLKELDHSTISKKKNISQKEFQAMRDLHNNKDITIKPADKGGNIVIMNTNGYIQEAQRQLSNPQHYKILNTDPTNQYNRYIHHIIDQAWRLGIINGTTKENLQTKKPKITLFYLLPKIHKPNNPGRPIVNSIGSITEKISAFVDEQLKKFTP